MIRGIKYYYKVNYVNDGIGDLSVYTITENEAIALKEQLEEKRVKTLNGLYLADNRRDPSRRADMVDLYSRETVIENLPYGRMID